MSYYMAIEMTDIFLKWEKFLTKTGVMAGHIT